MALLPPCPHTQKTLSETGYLDLNFSTSLFLSLSSAANIPDPAVAKIKDFLPSFLPQLSFHGLGKTKGWMTIPLPSGERVLELLGRPVGSHIMQAV